MNETKTNKYILFILVLVLFFTKSVLSAIPAMIFHLDMNNLTGTQSVLLNIYSNAFVLLILILIYKASLKKDLINFKNNFSNYFYVSMKIWIIGIVLMITFNLIIGMFTKSPTSNNEAALRNLISYSPYAMIVNTVLLSPAVEEIVFRKSFRNVFKNDLAFILISGIVFGALHVILSIKTATDFLYLLPYCSLGLCFSYMYYKTKNIYAPIFVHMLHNLITTLLSIFYMVIVLW